MRKANKKKTLAPVPAIHTPPFTNLTNNLPLQQKQRTNILSQQYQMNNSSLLQQNNLSLQQLQQLQYDTTDSLNDTTRYEMVALPSHIVHHDNSQFSNVVASTAIVTESSSIPISTHITPPTNKINRWVSSEVRMLIEQAGKHQQALQRAKDPREKGRIWDKIISTIQNSDMASSSLKERTKASIQQKWDSLLQKYRDIKDKISRTGEEPIQNEWEFFRDMDEYLKEDPSITAPIIVDSIHGVKHKIQKPENQDEENNIKKRKNSRSADEEKANVEEFRSFIKEQTETITEIMKNQFLHASEIQQRQHSEQMEIFRQFLNKF
ncbi:trihelix transcription factor GT-3a-like [Rhizophagus clarus]|uniref:Trihelix transcription factor GT-3a-like n=1 Tax=Rhizophagus clarus TaxID=94130 RepID=A0A8H3LIM9_9GLOM|nr:trihelix transcription factor GT-3a-like [Rhizophagus clarus]